MSFIPRPDLPVLRFVSVRHKLHSNANSFMNRRRQAVVEIGSAASDRTSLKSLRQIAATSAVRRYGSSSLRRHTHAIASIRQSPFIQSGDPCCSPSHSSLLSEDWVCRIYTQLCGFFVAKRENKIALTGASNDPGTRDP